MVAKAEKDFGAVDILVNNAGIQHVAPIEEFPTEKWDAIIAINLSSAFHAIRAAVPGMKARKLGPHHQHLLGAFAGGLAVQVGLRRRQARPGRPDQERGAGDWPTLGITVNAISPGLRLDAAGREADPRHRQGRRHHARRQVKKDVLLAAQPTQAVRHRRAGRRAGAVSGEPTAPARSPAPTSRSTAAGRPNDVTGIHGEDQPRAAGRRRAWRLHLGRARPPAGGRAHRDRGHQRHQRRRHERRGAGRGYGRGRAAEGARSSSPSSGAGRRRGAASSNRLATAGPSWRRPGGLDQTAAAIAMFGWMTQIALALPVQSAQHQSAARHAAARQSISTRCSSCDCTAPVHLRHQRAHRQDASLHRRRGHGRCGAGLGLPADRVPGGRDRRRSLLGRRLHGQSGDLTVPRAPAIHPTCCWCRSTRSGARRCHDRRPASSTG